MGKQALLYNLYFKAEDRFLHHPIQPGYEADIIVDFVQAGMNLATYYCRYSPQANPILQELFLRRIFFFLIETISHSKHSRIFKRICVDHLHYPLLALKKFYGSSANGQQRYFSLQRNVLQIHNNLGL